MNWVFHFDLEYLKNRVKELQELSYKENFWDDVKKAQGIIQEIKALTSEIDQYEELVEEIDDMEVLIELMLQDETFADYKEIEKGLASLEKSSNGFKIKTLLSGEFDQNNAILSIHSGAGGLEAQDWAEMLLKMYRRWADTKEYRVETLDLLSDTEGGIKSVTLLIEGYNAYGYLK